MMARPHPVPAAAEAPGPVAGLADLLAVEADARMATREVELLHLLANEGRRILRARQVFVLRRRRGGAERVVAISSVPVVDADAPVVRWIEAIAGRLGTGRTARDVAAFALPDHADPRDSLTGSYPFRHFLAVPLWSRGATLDAWLMLARDTAWVERDRVVANRLAGAFGHAWCLLLSPEPLWRAWRRPRRVTAGAVLLGLAASAIPVPLTALAPLEVVARDPVIVAMPLDGQIGDVPVAPNTRVAAGDVLVRLVDTVQRNKLQIAEREVMVSEARLQKAGQLAFSEARGRHDLGIARAELALRIAERDFARDMMGRTEIRSARAGLALFADRRDLVGRPLATGDRIMEIADPDRVELRIELPIADSIVLAEGGPVKVFLDSDPLRPVTARIAHADYRARVAEGKVAAYHVTAVLDDRGAAQPRLGVRGTAQLFGERVPLGFFLLRRPISAARQWLGL